MDIKSPIGVRLKGQREKKGWNQRELARISGVDHTWISKLESGTRHNIYLEGAMRLAIALGVSLDYLAGMPGVRHDHASEA